MLKKAGIVVAAGAASLLALSPLAFAGDSGDHHGKGGHGSANVAEKNSSGLVNLSNNNLDVSPQTCVGPIASGNNILTGALGLVSKAETSNEQDQSVDCTNASQAGDNVEQNADDKGGKGSKG